MGTDDAKGACEDVKQPIEGNLIQHAHIPANGRVVSDMQFSRSRARRIQEPRRSVQLVATLPGDGCSSQRKKRLPYLAAS